MKIEQELPLRITPNNNPFFTGLFASVSREITADDLPVIGEIPKDLEGVYLRNGPNPITPSFPAALRCSHVTAAMTTSNGSRQLPASSITW